MKIEDLKIGMKVRAIGDYADCIHAGAEYEVFANSDGEPCIACEAGSHELTSSATDDGEMPELEPS